MFLPLPLTIWLSLVLAGLAVSDCGLSLLQACVSVLLGDQFSLGGIWVWRAVAQGQLWGADRNQKDPVPGCSLVPVSWWLWAGPSWARNLSRSGGLTCAHRCVSTPGRPALSWQYLGMEICGTGWALEPSFVWDGRLLMTASISLGIIGLFKYFPWSWFNFDKWNLSRKSSISDRFFNFMDGVQAL